MLLNVKQNCKYDLVVPTSMGVRIIPEGNQPVHTSSHYLMTATSAESNVLSVPAALGMNTMVLTTFVKDSPIAEFIKRDLRARRIEYFGVEVEQGGPWGYRHQFNIADAGYGSRGPVVHNDRAGEVGLTLDQKDFDLDDLFGKKGVKLLHLSGLIAALSHETSQFCLTLAREAKKHGTLISFDLNYRATFWKNREEELTEIFHEIASLSDILIGNEEDFQLCLKMKGVEAGGKDLSQKIYAFKEMIEQTKKNFPNTKIFATTLRQVISANAHLWGAIVNCNNSWEIINPKEIGVLDRIGGGDAFVSGMLYGVLNGWTLDQCAQFGWATGALCVTMNTDYCLPSSEEQVWRIFKQDARVKR